MPEATGIEMEPLNRSDSNNSDEASDGADAEAEVELLEQSDDKLRYPQFRSVAQANDWFHRPLFAWDWMRYSNGELYTKFSLRSIFTPILAHPFSILFVIAMFILIDCLYIWEFPPISWEGWFALISVIIAFGVMTADICSPTFVFLWLMFLYTATRIITPAEALVGFCNSSVATIALLFSLAGALEDNGLMYYIAKFILGGSKSQFVAINRLVWTMFPISAFINNTPQVAVMIPACQNWSLKTGIPVSKLLMPLSFSTILGGTLTNIGTSTNLIIVGLAKVRYPDVSVGFFDVGYPGLPAAIVGSIYLVIISRFLPVRKNLAMDYLADNEKDYTFSLEVGEKFGTKKTVDYFRGFKGIYLFEIERGEEVFAAPAPETHVFPGDVLKFTGTLADAAPLFVKDDVLKPHHSLRQVTGLPEKRKLVEVVVSHRASFVQCTAKESRFRTNFDAAILAVSRDEHRIEQTVSDIVIHPGDTLLLEASPLFIDKWASSRKQFSSCHIVGAGLDAQKPKKFKLLLVSAGILTMIILSASDVEDIFILCGLLFCLFITLGLQTWREALSKMEGEILFQIAASFVLGTALSNTGVAKILGDILLSIFEPGGAIMVLYGAYVTTALFTAILTNAAAATVVLPITQPFVDSGLVTAKAVVIIVMLAASCDFMTSIGYQTNIMVCKAGNYRFTDFTKFGLPLTFIVSVVGTICTDFFFN